MVVSRSLCIFHRNKRFGKPVLDCCSTMFARHVSGTQLPMSQRSLSTRSMTLVLAQWFWPSWLHRAVSCETCFVIIEKLSFAFPLRVKQQVSVLLSYNHEDLVVLLLFHWFLLLKNELKWSHFRQDKFWFDFCKKQRFLPFCPVSTNCYTCCTKHSGFVQQRKTKRRCTISEVSSMRTSPLQISQVYNFWGLANDHLSFPNT